MKKIHVILLAAGNSSRFGNNKLLYRYRGKPLYQHMLLAVREAEKKLSPKAILGEKVLVTQYEEIAREGEKLGFQCLKNEAPERGISSSIRLGLEAVEASDRYEPGDAALFAVCDQPKLSADTLSGMLWKYAENDKRERKGILCASWKETLGNPVIFGDRYWKELKELTEDQGGKTVVKRHLKEVEHYDVKIPEELRDIDVPGDVSPLVLVRGGGDLATGTIYKLYREGYRVLVLETARPACIRRQVSFCEAVYEGETMVEGVRSVLITGEEQARKAWDCGKIPVYIDPEARSIERFQPEVLIDAILAKKNLGTKKEMAPLTIGLGPGFVAGRDVDVVVETMRGRMLGAVYYEGSAIPNTGVPGVIAGYSKERVIHAPAAGRFEPEKAIGEQVLTGEILGWIVSEEEEKIPIPATMPGLLRGMIKEGYPVWQGLKIMDLEPRTEDRELCFHISDKAKCIGESVYQVIREYEDTKTEGPCM